MKKCLLGYGYKVLRVEIVEVAGEIQSGGVNDAERSLRDSEPPRLKIASKFADKRGKRQNDTITENSFLRLSVQTRGACG